MSYPTSVLAVGSLESAAQQLGTPGTVFVLLLALLSMICWAIMATKRAMLSRARVANVEFISANRATTYPLTIFQTGERYEAAPAFHIYYKAARQLAFYLVGTTTPDRTFAVRLQGAAPIAPSELGMVRSAAQRALSEATVRLEQKLPIVAVVLQLIPFIGLLGALWMLMVGAPLATAALIGVAALIALVPALAAYHGLLHSLRMITVRMEHFVEELVSDFDSVYVDHRLHHQTAKMPSVGDVGTPKLG
jgi:biopolymer transport protein ExbB/TolQ